MRFAELKEKRIDGLISHASFPISIGKLEGFNDKIKVAKRIGYGDDDYFFLIVSFLSSVAKLSVKNRLFLPSMASCMLNEITKKQYEYEICD